LKDAAMRMQKYLGDDSYPARIGGDEFLTIIRNTPPETVDQLLNDFSKMDKYVEYKGHKVSYSMSVGYAVYPQDADNYNQLYQNADLALYEVKMNGKNNYRKYTTDIVKEERKGLGFNPATISDGLPGGFLVYRNDDSGEILFANKRLLEIYECDSMEEFREFTGNSFRGCVHEDDYDIVIQSIEKEIEDQDEYDYVQYRALTKGGNIKIIEDYGRLLHSTNNGDLFYVFMLDYEQKHQIYKSIVDNIHRHWKEDK
jgi:PAS domain-containing protein